jgi:excisionase family DNA binding protein
MSRVSSPSSAVDKLVQNIEVALPPALVDHIVERVAQRVLELQADETPVWLDVDAAATYMGRPRRRLYDLVAQGRLEHRKDGSRLMFRRSWLDAYLEASG